MRASIQRRVQGTSRPAMATTSALPPVGAVTLVILTLSWMTFGCGPDVERGEVAIDRDTFIQVQAEIQVAAMESDTDVLPLAQRDSILRERGIDNDILQAFLAVHGDDEDYMAEVWAEVDERVRETMGLGPGEADDPDREGEPPG